MTWEVGGNLGRHKRPGVDASGWLWELRRGDQVARVLIEITGTAWSTDPRQLPGDTLKALQTDGRTELLKALDEEVPPSVIQCGTSGCSHLEAGS